MTDQQEKLFQDAARDMEQERLLQQKEMAEQGFPMVQDAGTPFDQQQMHPAAMDDQNMMPITSSDMFFDIIEQTDFMVEDNNDDEGLGGYADCEMMPNEPDHAPFIFEN